MRELFKMNAENYPENVKHNAETWDDETTDEMCYDNQSALKTMDFVYKETKDNLLFQAIYDLAAAQMISTDREIGLCVLFSYDYMRYFHRCIMDYLKSPVEFSSNNENYRDLLERLE
jgi:hypothetical protein